MTKKKVKKWKMIVERTDVLQYTLILLPNIEVFVKNKDHGYGVICAWIKWAICFQMDKV